MPLLVIILSGMSVRTHCLTAHCLVLYGSFFLLYFFGGSAYPCLFFVELVLLLSWAANSKRTTIGYFYMFMYRECKSNHYLSVFFRLLDTSQKPIAFRHINDIEGILIVMPSASLAYICISYLHITILLCL